MAKYHLEVWLKTDAIVKPMELQLFTFHGQQHNTMELGDPTTSTVEDIFDKVRVNGQIIPPAMSLDTSHGTGTPTRRPGFYVRKDVTVEDFRVTVHRG